MSFRETADAVVASTNRAPAKGHSDVSSLIRQMRGVGMSTLDIAIELRSLNLIVSERTIRSWGGER